MVAAELPKASHEPVYSTRSDLSPCPAKLLKSGDADWQKMDSSDASSVRPNGSEQRL
jgi:hypothetical protein